MIYLDNNATTRVADEVVAAMVPYYSDLYGNPHSAHALGRKASEGIEHARFEIASLLGARDEEIFFTSCGTESNALAILGCLEQSSRRKIVTTAVEHPSVLALLRTLQQQGRIDLAIVGVDSEGAVDVAEMSDAIDDTTLLVSVMLAQNETGVILPVEHAAALARARGALVHVDAVQAAGKIPIDAPALGADFLSISGHKFHAPKGAGALYVRRGTKLAPIWQGGNQEHGLRSGTEAVPLLVGLGRAASLAIETMDRQKNVRRLRDELERRLIESLPDVESNGGGPRLPNTASISFRDVLSDRIVSGLDERGVCVSAGAACHSGKVEASAVMRAMSKPLDYALGTVRFSLSRYTTEAELDQAVEAVTTVIGGLRGEQSAATGERRSNA